MFRLTKKERERFGEKFAKLLLYGGDNVSFNQLTSLTCRKDWKNAERHERKETVVQCKIEPFIRY